MTIKFHVKFLVIEMKPAMLLEEKRIDGIVPKYVMPLINKLFIMLCYNNEV